MRAVGIFVVMVMMTLLVVFTMKRMTKAKKQ